MEIKRAIQKAVLLAMAVGLSGCVGFEPHGETTNEWFQQAASPRITPTEKQQQLVNDLPKQSFAATKEGMRVQLRENELWVLLHAMQGYCVWAIFEDPSQCNLAVDRQDTVEENRAFCVRITSPAPLKYAWTSGFEGEPIPTTSMTYQMRRKINIAEKFRRVDLRKKGISPNTYFLFPKALDETGYFSMLNELFQFYGQTGGGK